MIAPEVIFPELSRVIPVLHADERRRPLDKFPFPIVAVALHAPFGEELAPGGDQLPGHVAELSPHVLGHHEDAHATRSRTSAAIRPSAMATSAATRPSGETTVPPRMTRSNVLTSRLPAPPPAGPLPAYMAVIVLARVIVRLGTLPDIHTGVIEGLYASDLAYLQRLYESLNAEDDIDAQTPLPRMPVLGEA